MIKLTEGQAMRLQAALSATMESVVLCELPHAMRGREIQAVANELLEQFAKGEEYPQSMTEKVWHDQELRQTGRSSEIFK